MNPLKNILESYHPNANLLVTPIAEQAKNGGQEELNYTQTAMSAKLSPAQLMQGKKMPGSVKIVVISSRVEGWQQLRDAAQEGVKVITYDTTRTTLSQMYKRVQQSLKGALASDIAFIGHGNAGSFELLSNLKVDARTLENNVSLRTFWRDIGQLIGADGTIDLPACSLVQNFEGIQLVEQLKELTKAQIGASTDDTGNEADGGNWLMETTGVDLRQKYFDPKKITSWHGKLAYAADALVSTPGSNCYKIIAGSNIEALLKDLHLLQELCKGAKIFRNKDNSFITGTNDPRLLAMKQTVGEIDAIHQRVLSYIASASRETCGLKTAGDIQAFANGLQNITTQLTANLYAHITGISLSATPSAADFMEQAELFFSTGTGTELYSTQIRQLFQCINDELDFLSDKGIIAKISFAGPLAAVRAFVLSAFENINCKMGELGQENARRSRILEVLGKIESLLSQNWSCDAWGSLRGYIETDNGGSGSKKYTAMGQAFFSTDPSSIADVDSTKVVHYGLLFGADRGIIDTESLWALHAQTTQYLEYTIPPGFTSDIATNALSPAEFTAIKNDIFGTNVHPLWGAYGGALQDTLFQRELQQFNLSRSDLDITALQAAKTLWVPVRPGLTCMRPTQLQDSTLQQVLDQLYALQNNGFISDTGQLADLSKIVANLKQALQLNSSVSSFSASFTTSKYKLYSGAMADQPYPAKIDTAQLIFDGTVDTTPFPSLSNASAADVWYKQLYNAVRFWEGAIWTGSEWVNDQSNASSEMVDQLLNNVQDFSDKALQQMNTLISLFQELLRFDKSVFQHYKDTIQRIDQAMTGS